jgi:hypothetical protein
VVYSSFAADAEAVATAAVFVASLFAVIEARRQHDGSHDPGLTAINGKQWTLQVQPLPGGAWRGATDDATAMLAAVLQEMTGHPGFDTQAESLARFNRMVRAVETAHKANAVVMGRSDERMDLYTFIMNADGEAGAQIIHGDANGELLVSVALLTRGLPTVAMPRWPACDALTALALLGIGEEHYQAVSTWWSDDWRRLQAEGAARGSASAEGQLMASAPLLMADRDRLLAASATNGRIQEAAFVITMKGFVPHGGPGAAAGVKRVVLTVNSMARLSGEASLDADAQTHAAHIALLYRTFPALVRFLHADRSYSPSPESHLEPGRLARCIQAFMAASAGWGTQPPAAESEVWARLIGHAWKAQSREQWPEWVPEMVTKALTRSDKATLAEAMAAIDAREGGLPTA